MITKVKIKHKDISNFTFAQALQKIAATPTDGKSACRIRNLTRGLTEARKKIVADYQTEIVDVYGKKDEKGQVIRPEGQPLGFEPMEEKQEEFLKAQEAFGEKESGIECIPLTLNEIKDVKLSAQELEAMGEFFSENLPGPGVPDNVASIR